jgi:hypothetical protein
MSFTCPATLVRTLIAALATAALAQGVLAQAAAASTPSIVYAPSLTKLKTSNPEDDSNCFGGMLSYFSPAVGKPMYHYGNHRAHMSCAGYPVSIWGESWYVDESGQRVWLAKCATTGGAKCEAGPRNTDTPYRELTVMSHHASFTMILSSGVWMRSPEDGDVFPFCSGYGSNRLVCSRANHFLVAASAWTNWG